MKNTDPYQLARLSEEIASAYRLSLDDILGPRRDVLACAARAEVLWTARGAGYSLTFLSQYFRRDHTSILNAVRRHKEKIDAQAEVVFRRRERPAQNQQEKARAAIDESGKDALTSFHHRTAPI